MKYLLTLLLAVSLYAGETNNFTTIDYWKQDDKQDHFRRSAEIAIVSTAIARHYGNSKLASFFIGVGTTIIIGWAKEVYDGTQDDHTKDIDDIDADMFGALTGSLIATQFNWRF